MNKPFRDERGVALPMVLIALVILSALVVAFSVLSSTEPTIAGNQLRVAQARALAESAVERALWALTAGKVSPGTTGSLAYPLPATVPAPYDGSQLISVAAAGNQLGGFRVTVTQGATQNERNVVAVGWVPTDTSSDTRTKAHQRITVTLMDLFDPGKMPCALCVRGDLQVGGNSTIDATQDTSCGNKYGTWSTRTVDGNGNVISPGDTTLSSGAAHILGADGNSTANQSTDMATEQNQAAFDANKMTNTDLTALKTLAKRLGTYFQGAVTFDASNRLPTGLIFVDTVSGNNIDPATTPASDYASVDIHGNAGSGPNNSWNGWIVVNGTLAISGNIQLNGLVYAQNDISYTGTGTGRITGQMISANVKDTIATVIDTSTFGNSQIIYNCAAAQSGGGTIPPNFIVEPGTYKEVSD